MVSEIILGIVIVSCIGAIAWQQYVFQKTIRNLTDKLVARDATELRIIQEPRKVKQNGVDNAEKPRKPVDPTLGSRY